MDVVIAIGIEWKYFLKQKKKKKNEKIIMIVNQNKFFVLFLKKCPVLISHTHTHLMLVFSFKNNF